VREHLPEKHFGQEGVAMSAGMRKPVAAGRSGATDTRQPAEIVAQRVAHVVQADDMRELRIKQRHEATPGAERAHHRFHAGFTHLLRHPMSGEMVAQSRADREFSFVWSWSGFSFFHTQSLSRPGKTANSSRLLSFALGRLWKPYLGMIHSKRYPYYHLASDHDGLIKRIVCNPVDRSHHTSINPKMLMMKLSPTAPPQRIPCALLFLACYISPAAATFAQAVKEEDVIKLSPFTVDSSRDLGYQAENTLSGSRLNSSLRDTAGSISVFTKDFLDDIGDRKPASLPGIFRFQVNVSNLFNRTEIIPIRLSTSAAAPDGFMLPGGRGMAYSRFDVVAPRELRFTTSYSF